MKSNKQSDSILLERVRAPSLAVGVCRAFLRVCQSSTLRLAFALQSCRVFSDAIMLIMLLFEEAKLSWGYRWRRSFSDRVRGDEEENGAGVGKECVVIVVRMAEGGVGGVVRKSKLCLCLEAEVSGYNWCL